MKHILTALSITILTACGGGGDSTEANTPSAPSAPESPTEPTEPETPIEPTDPTITPQMLEYQAAYRIFVDDWRDNLEAGTGDDSILQSIMFTTTVKDIDGNENVFIYRVSGGDVPENALLLKYTDNGYVLEEQALTGVSRHGVVADFNNDGRDDLYRKFHGREWGETHIHGGINSVIMQDEYGSFYDTFQSFHDEDMEDGDYTHNASTFDFDGDLDQDVFVGNHVHPYILVNDGKGNFTRDDTILPQQAKDVGHWWSGTGDFNGDGFDDLIMGMQGECTHKWCVTYYDEATGVNMHRTDMILLSDGKKLIWDENTPILETNYRDDLSDGSPITIGITVADFNNDGCLDYASNITNYIHMNGYTLNLGDCGNSGVVSASDGEYQPPVVKFDRVYDNMMVDENELTGFGAWNSSIHTHDVNNDGLLDVVTYPNNINNFSFDDALVLLNNGNGFDYTHMTEEQVYQLPLEAFISFRWEDTHEWARWW